MTQEQLVVAGLNLDQQFRQTYQAAHALVKAFQKLYQEPIKLYLSNSKSKSKKEPNS
jgi:hypothetical protein